MTVDRWERLMRAWGLPTSLDTFHALTRAYGESHRHYHTGAHLSACLAHLDRAVDHASVPAVLELALWFHDAVYRPLRHDNEERSAQWAAQFLRDHAIADPLIEDVERLILTTTHAHFPQGMDASLMVDIDLAILGSDEREYGGFEDAIRREYRWVPWALYRRKRAALLRAFLERPAVFQHEPFVSDYEAAARRNLAAAIRRLEDG